MPTTSVPDTEDDPVRPLRRSRRSRLPRCIGPLVVAAGAIALVTLSMSMGRAPAPDVSPPAPEGSPGSGFLPAATRMARPAEPVALTAPRFLLDDPGSLEPVRAEPARRNPSTGQREDTLVQGGFSAIEGPYLRLTLTESSDSAPRQSLFVTLARRAADGQGLAVIRTGERGVIESKFGAVETLDITLGGEGRRVCTGFASLAPGPFHLDGWLCAPLGQAPASRAITCALDKIAPNGQAWPEGARAFVELDARRDPACHPAPIADRDASTQTGSIAHRRTRKNEAKLRPSRKAQP